MSKLHTVTYLIFIVVFGVFAYFAHRFPYFPGDVSISQLIQRVDLPLFRPFLEFVSAVPSVAVVAPVAVILLVFRKRWETLFIIALPISAWLLNLIIKPLVERPRPPEELVRVLVSVNEYGFPSGHVLQAAVLCGFLFFLAPRLLRQPWAAILRVVLVILILLVVISRIYLGVHWFSDVMGGLLFAGLLVAPAVILYKNYAIRKRGYGNA